ncbi:MAG: hypothetical protein GC172_09825 [Phycisphaera sp.]|nr:hypothetical protein [Phycisphaera sp.]
MTKSKGTKRRIRVRTDDFVDELGAHGWAKRNQPRHGMSVGYWYQLARSQNYRCAITDAPILFHSKYARTMKKGDTVHPLYAAVERTDGDGKNEGHRLVCYAIHEATAALPRDLLLELRRTRAWVALVRAWRAQAATGSLDRQPFDRLVPPRKS